MSMFVFISSRAHWEKFLFYKHRIGGSSNPVQSCIEKMIFSKSLGGGSPNISL